MEAQRTYLPRSPLEFLSSTPLGMKPDGEHSIRFSQPFALEFKSLTPATALKQNSESRLLRRNGQIAPFL